MPHILEIPKSQKAALARLLGSSQSEKERLLSALGETQPAIFGEKFATAFARKASMASGEAVELFSTLASLYVSMDIANEPPETFAGEVCDTIKESKDPEFHLEEGRWEDFRKYLAKVLSLDATLGVSAKASELKTEYTNVFCTARIITDLRPIYGRDVLKGPKAAVVVHEARITFHEDGGDATKDFYVVLDAPDIQQMKKLLDRAVQKERSLKAMARNGGMNVLES